jgi:hypothetical protein
MSTVVEFSTTKSEKLKIDSFRKQSPATINENPELINKSFNKKILFSKSIKEYESINMNFEKKTNQLQQSSS